MDLIQVISADRIRALRKAGFVVIRKVPTPDEVRIVQEVSAQCVEAKCDESGKHAWKQVAAAGADMMSAALEPSHD